MKIIGRSLFEWGSKELRQADVHVWRLCHYCDTLMLSFLLVVVNFNNSCTVANRY